MAEILNLKDEHLLLLECFAEDRGEPFCWLTDWDRDLLFFQDIPIRAGHLRTVRGRAGVGDEGVAGYTRNNDRVIL